MFTSGEIAQTDFAPWAEFGLAGLVICALFAVLGLTIRIALTKFDEREQRHNAERSEWRGLHASEREAWRNDATTRSEALRIVVAELRDAVRDLARK